MEHPLGNEGYERAAQAGAEGRGRRPAPGGAAPPAQEPLPQDPRPLYEQLVRARLLTILDDRDAPIHSLVDEKALRAGLLSDAGDYGKPWFGQLMAGPQMLAYLIQINEWMSRYHLTV